MIIDEITLHNFGLYAGSQTLKLTPPSRNKPIILIGGMNGCGKTTLMDALQLCLFGPHAKTSNRGSIAYRNYLSKCINKGSINREAAIRLSFRHRANGKEELYTLNRSWYVETGTCKESFSVSRNGLLERALATNWSSQVDEFLPVNIAHLFLFDGEQIEGYASGEDSSSLIGAGIQNLLGLDMVDQLQKDLRVYERRKRVEPKNNALRVTIAVVEKNLRELRSRVDELKQGRAALLTHQLDRKRKALSKIEDVYRKLGGVLFDQRNEIEQRLAIAEGATKDAAASLRDLAAGSMPLLLVRSLMKSVDSRDRHEEACRRSRELIELVEARDMEVLRYLTSTAVETDLIQQLKDYFEKDRSRLKKLGKHRMVLNLTPSARSDLRSLLRVRFKQVLSLASQHLESQRKAKLRAQSVRTEHENIPTPDIIAGVIAERDSVRREIAALEIRYEGIGEEIHRVEREIESKERLLVRLLQDDANADSRSEDRKRILQHSKRVHRTLLAYREAVIRRHTSQIEQLVLESFQQLLSKAHLITNLSINPVNFHLNLFDRDGNVLNADWLSAGERQLLSVALLWGLAKASGRPLPTAIDTPLGRLDSSHRMNLVKRYFPFASHQILLLSTDEEIIGDYFQYLKPWIGRTYMLAYDDHRQRTEVIQGYFGSKGDI